MSLDDNMQRDLPRSLLPVWRRPALSAYNLSSSHATPGEDGQTHWGYYIIIHAPIIYISQSCFVYVMTPQVSRSSIYMRRGLIYAEHDRHVCVSTKVMEKHNHQESQTTSHLLELICAWPKLYSAFSTLRFMKACLRFVLFSWSLSWKRIVILNVKTRIWFIIPFEGMLSFGYYFKPLDINYVPYDSCIILARKCKLL